jgi:hypothetical protein
MELNHATAGPVVVQTARVFSVLRAAAIVGAMIALQSHAISAQALTCGFPTSSTLSPSCTSSWVATSGFVVTGAVDTTPTSVTATGASASTSFNLNQLVLSTTSVFGQNQGESRFLDTFEVTGGSGAGTATFYWTATGTVQQFQPPPNCDPFRDGVSIEVAVSRWRSRMTFHSSGASHSRAPL